MPDNKPNIYLQVYLNTPSHSLCTHRPLFYGNTASQPNSIDALAGQIQALRTGTATVAA